MLVFSFDSFLRASRLMAAGDESGYWKFKSLKICYIFVQFSLLLCKFAPLILQGIDETLEAVKIYYTDVRLRII